MLIHKEIAKRYVLQQLSGPDEEDVQENLNKIRENDEKEGIDGPNAMDIDELELCDNKDAVENRFKRLDRL